MSRPPPAPRECAVCGADVPRGARACPECGADERTGWREPDPYDGLDLPEQAWTDDRDAHSQSPARSGPAWYWWLTAVLLLVALGVALIGLG